MNGLSALAALPAVEGAPVLGAYNFFATLDAGPQASPTAGEHGVAVGRFGWMNRLGVVLNERTDVDDMIGLVVPQIGPGVTWQRVFYDDVTLTWRVRRGLPVPMLTRGNVWVRFSGGAYLGQSVYANLLDGSAIAGYSVDGELTRWSVSIPCAPGQLGAISTLR